MPQDPSFNIHVPAGLPNAAGYPEQVVTFDGATHLINFPNASASAVIGPLTLLDGQPQAEMTPEMAALWGTAHAPEGYSPGMDDQGRLVLLRPEDYLHADLPTQVEKSIALAQKLFSNGNLGCDVLYLQPNARFHLHTHPGDHLLLILKGYGTVTYGGTVYPTVPGDLYMVPGLVEHAVGAGPEGHWLLSIGSPHKPADSAERMHITEDGVPDDARAADLIAAELARKDEGGDEW